MMFSSSFFKSSGQTGLRFIGRKAQILTIMLLLLSFHTIQAAPDPGDIVATVDGKPILRKEINNPALAKAREEAYALEMRLLTLEAIKRLRANRPKEFPLPEMAVTEAEIMAVYKRANLSEKGPLEAYEDRIRDFILADRVNRHDQDLFEKAVRKGYIQSRLKPPPPFLFRLASVKRKASRGPENAPVHIIEFSDFQ